MKKKMRAKDFEFIMPLGQGAFGEVFLVKKGEQYFALKAMKKRNYNGLMNFVVTEKEIQRKIKHRFIVKLRYAFQTYDKLYLVSDFCQGGDLRAVINSRKGLKEEEARFYISEIIIAVEEIHRNGIIHRDIKLDNILLDKNGHAKLTDFGLAKEGIFESNLTNTILGGG